MNMEIWVTEIKGTLRDDWGHRRFCWWKTTGSRRQSRNMGAYKRTYDSNSRMKMIKGDKNLDDKEGPASWPLIPVMDGTASSKVILPEMQKNFKSSYNFKCTFLEFHSCLPGIWQNKKNLFINTFECGP